MKVEGVDADLLAGALLPILLGVLLMGAVIGGSMLKPDAKRRVEQALRRLAQFACIAMAFALAWRLSAGKWSVNWWMFTAAAGSALIMQIGSHLSRRDRLKS